MSWGAAAGATSYDVYFGTGGTAPFVANTTATTYSPGTLAREHDLLLAHRCQERLRNRTLRDLVLYHASRRCSSIRSLRAGWSIRAAPLPDLTESLLSRGRRYPAGGTIDDPRAIRRRSQRQHHARALRRDSFHRPSLLV